jgi:Arc/MetJ-type ribon-helix-helix transcriptional regulator
MPSSPRITIRLTPALEALVSARVRQGSSVSDIVRKALEAYLGACVRCTTGRVARIMPRCLGSTA